MKDEGRNMNEDLRIRTKQFALRIIRLFTALPRTEVARVLGKQALRSGTSWRQFALGFRIPRQGSRLNP